MTFLSLRAPCKDDIGIGKFRLGAGGRQAWVTPCTVCPAIKDFKYVPSQVCTLPRRTEKLDTQPIRTCGSGLGYRGSEFRVVTCMQPMALMYGLPEWAYHVYAH